MRRIGIGNGVVMAALLAGAGCGSLYGGGGGGPTVEVLGNIDAVVPDGTGRDILVFVYQLKDEIDDCTAPELPADGTPFKFDIVEDGETTFRVPHSKIGRLVVAFLLDNEGHDADGEIDPGDPVALLDDPDCVLDDVPDNYVVEIGDVRINFDLDDEIGFPAPGRAEADIVERPAK